MNWCPIHERYYDGRSLCYECENRDYDQEGYSAAVSDEDRVVPRDILVDCGKVAAEEWYVGYDRRRDEEADAVLGLPEPIPLSEGRLQLRSLAWSD